MTSKHEASCTCDICVAYRAARRQNADPLMRKKAPEHTSKLIPVTERIAQLLESRECYQDKLNAIDTEISTLRDI